MNTDPLELDCPQETGRSTFSACPLSRRLFLFLIYFVHVFSYLPTSTKLCTYSSSVSWVSLPLVYSVSFSAAKLFWFCFFPGKLFTPVNPFWKSPFDFWPRKDLMQVCSFDTTDIKSHKPTIQISSKVIQCSLRSPARVALCPCLQKPYINTQMVHVRPAKGCMKCHIVI